jgi:putative integral membrane protein (TIGR02587 family)
MTTARDRARLTQRPREFLVGLARAFGGAVFFSIPLLMTMEMWWLGFYMDRARLAILLAVMIPLLIALDHYVGFKHTTSWTEDFVDGMVAYGVGIVASAVALLLFNELNAELPLREWVGKIALQSVPASFGAVLAGSLLGGGGNVDDEDGGPDSEAERVEEASYGAELLFMTAGALFLGFSVSPTEEMILIAYSMTPWHALALALATLALMHGFVYALEFQGAPSVAAGTPGWSLFLRFTVVGYAIAILVSSYVLWTFGRFESAALGMHITQTLVLAFPSALGAAAARLII